MGCHKCSDRAFAAFPAQKRLSSPYSPNQLVASMMTKYSEDPEQRELTGDKAKSRSASSALIRTSLTINRDAAAEPFPNSPSADPADTACNAGL